MAEETEASEEDEAVFKIIIFDKMMRTATITENRKMKTGRIEFTTDRIARRVSKMKILMRGTMKTRRSRISQLKWSKEEIQSNSNLLTHLQVI